MNKEIYIIGGGCSLQNKNLRMLQNKETIVTNKSICYVPNPNWFITMDYTFLRKMGNHFEQTFYNEKIPKVFIANFASPHLEEKNGHIVDIRWNLVYDLRDFNLIIKSYKTSGLGYHFGDFRNGDNTGYSALQLAIILGYTEINLLGLDLQVGQFTHFHKGYGENKDKFQNKLNKYYNYFKNSLAQLKKERPDINIYSCSETSKLNKFLPQKKL